MAVKIKGVRQPKPIDVEQEVDAILRECDRETTICAHMICLKQQMAEDKENLDYASAEEKKAKLLVLIKEFWEL